MSFPLPPNLPFGSVAAIRGAAHLAQGAAHQLGQAFGFDEVLRSGGDVAGPAKSAQTLLAELTESIRRRLADVVGMPANPAVQLSVHADGELTVDGNHPRAAQIEAVLSEDPKLRQTARQLRQAGGPGEVLVDLTSGGGQENISSKPGGYANWLAD